MRKGIRITVVVVAAVAVVVAAIVTVVLLKRRKQVFVFRPIPTSGAPGAGRYHTLSSQAEAFAKAHGVLATYSQIDQAQKDGAQWCDWGWVKDDRPESPTLNQIIMVLPAQEAIALCGSSTGKVGISFGPTLTTSVADVVVYGIKPSESFNATGKGTIMPWSHLKDGTKKWSKYRI
jgi:hypothetical protein